MNKVTYGLVIGAVALGAAGFFGINDGVRSQGMEAGGNAEVPVAAITAAESIIVDAAVVPVREADLSLAGGGIVSDVLVEEGDTVQTGQPLVQLRDERLQANLAQADANLAKVEAQLAELLAPARQAEIAKYEANLTSAQAALQDVLEGASEAQLATKEAELANAEATLRQAQSNYDEVSWRSDIGRLPQALELEQATNTYRAARAALDDLLAAANAGEIAGANANVISAQADLALLLTGAEQDAIDAARATVAANQAAVADARAALAEATLVAPFSGTIAGVNVEVGEQVSAGMAVILLADTTRWRIETEDLTELDVVNVERGDKVEISFDALEGITLNGRVKSIKPLGENNQGDITYTVLVELEEQSGGTERLRWNMSAETTITVDEAGRATVAVNVAPVDRSESLADSGDKESIDRVKSQIMVEIANPTVDTHSSGTETESTLITGMVATGGAWLNVRSGPGTDFETIESLENGSQVAIVGGNDAGTWLQVALPNGAQGWVAAAFVGGEGDAGASASTGTIE